MGREETLSPMDHAPAVKTYWKSLEEREGETTSTDQNSEIRQVLTEAAKNQGTSRRSFLKLAGFSLASAGVGAGCSRAPALKAIPYLVPPDEIVPGRSYEIATTCGGCTASCAMLATCRDGRPTKLEGNPLQSWSGGGLCATGQASLLSLYDSHRLDGASLAKRTVLDEKETSPRSPDADFQSVSWEQSDREIRSQLESIRNREGQVCVLTRTVTSPSTKSTIESFLSTFKNARHVMFDPLSASSITDAHLATHGVRTLPRYRFDQAHIIVSFDADFLGTWISPVEYSKGYSEGRQPDAIPPKMSHHVHFESRMSLSGSRADRRILVAPWEVKRVVSRLETLVSQRAGSSSSSDKNSGSSSEKDPTATNSDQDLGLSAALNSSLETLSRKLWDKRGKCLVVCGVNDLDTQRSINRINSTLKNYGTTLDLASPSLQKQGDDHALSTLIDEMSEGRIDALIVQGVNPAYDLPPNAGFITALDKVGLVIKIASHRDETSRLADFVCAESHALESWDDAEAIKGLYSLTQPTVPPLRNARTLRKCLARWVGDVTKDRDLVQNHWKRNIWPEAQGAFPSSNFSRFFDKVLHDGCYETRKTSPESPLWIEAPSISTAPTTSTGPGDGEFRLILYPKVGLLDGVHAHNPWLQELPDPVTKISWDNYASLSPRTAQQLSMSQGDQVVLSAKDGRRLELPVQIQPGQHDGVVAVALGYGRLGTERFHDVGPAWLEARPTVSAQSPVGKNAAPFLTLTESGVRYDATSVKISRGAERVDLACSQDYHSLTVPPHLAPEGGEVRDAVQEISLADWVENLDLDHSSSHHDTVDLWPEDHPKKGPRWGLAIDLTACTGCSACVVSCQAENNIPVVGKDEVRRHREMHWIRIDRYYQEENSDLRTVHQPMMCHHCTNAPCETVCPVLATVHSSEGLNQQVYNRCVGTRYCANNCPYKVRRFNWFDYPREDQLLNMALNPDVTIRSRGVMEKCSLCVQRIQAAKGEAQRQGKPLQDGAIQVACQQSCPTDAIVFGDLNDPESNISRSVSSHRSYSVLSELNLKPGVHYLAKISNDDLDPVEELRRSR